MMSNDIQDLSNLSIPLLQRKLKNQSEQVIFLRTENRLLYNYLNWYEKKIVLNEDQHKRDSQQIRLSSSFIHEIKSISNQNLKYKIKQPLHIQKKREIAEAIFKVLLGYSQKYSHDISQYIDESINTLETHDETIIYLELELGMLNKLSSQRKLTVEELFGFLHDRIRYRDTLIERKHQKSVRLQFQIDDIEKSIRKIRQLVDTVTEVDFEQLKIDIEKQLKELNMKNKMLIFYKRQQSEANMKLNEKKPELFKEICLLTSIRNTINNTVQQLNNYDLVIRKMQDEVLQYEKLNDPLREMILTNRVPSIFEYVDLKSRQMNLHRQIHAWQRKVQIGERELHLRQIEVRHYQENIIHPWKYLENPSSILFNKHFQNIS